MSTARVRAATAADADAFAAVICAAQATWSAWAGPAFRPYDETELADTWRLRLQDTATVALCADADGAVVAVASAGPEYASHEPSELAPTSAHLSTLFARPDQHGAGVAHLLHDALLGELTVAGFSTVRLWVPAGAGRARRFYLRNLWVETGRSTSFAGLERIEMRRVVAAAA